MRVFLFGLGLSLIGSAASASVPRNDDVRRAVRVDGLPTVHASDTRTATTASTDPSCAGQGHTVWYSFTPSDDMRVEVNTFGSNYDTTLSAYIADSAGLALLACSDDIGDSLQSQVYINLIAGVTYYFMAGSYGESDGGDLVITFSTRPAAPELRISSSANLRSPGLVTLSGAITCAQASYVYVSGQVVQSGRGDRSGGDDRNSEFRWAQFYTDGLPCDGRTLWTAHPLPIEGLFRRGYAFVLATVTVCTDTCDFYSLSQWVSIGRARSGDRYSEDEQGRGRRHQQGHRRKHRS